MCVPRRWARRKELTDFMLELRDESEWAIVRGHAENWQECRGPKHSEVGVLETEDALAKFGKVCAKFLGFLRLILI